MPELPEVETIARTLRPQLIGKTIREADLRWNRTLAAPSPRKFKELVKGQQIKEVTRRAKYLILHLSSLRSGSGQAFSLLVHLRMSGDLLLRNSTTEPAPHDRLILKLSGGKSLAFNDTRKFGRVWLTADPQEILGALGPEPLSAEFTPAWLYTALHAKRRQLKPLLLDQTFLAGLGNIYTDEALHLAKLHPLRLSDSVSRRQAEALYEAIQSVLREGIRRNGASIDWVYRGGEFQNYFRVYDREGKPCLVCGALIQKFVVGQRGTHICPNCQVLK
ncbi:MAG: bifunctional DNA-formamidopyrimidine glycosylase/DNA-(apurinic or apyrimidinic site) lyase [Chloroflexota bacterium]|nr:bifunctional DNA-formamidopyrimidine glycosylase/DNA-(apurinic or apyrimidinic site) lyase [Chloroflexota bacterium]MBI5702468.1 bifunctional DNA-formamidopyrimidine glycosylase/DNA-(apurinic or apyrimidinic site) lyase [Chloroflexota bacterium]